MQILLQLFLTFVFIGILNFGGGYFGVHKYLLFRPRQLFFHF